MYSTQRLASFGHDSVDAFTCVDTYLSMLLLLISQTHPNKCAPSQDDGACEKVGETQHILSERLANAVRLRLDQLVISRSARYTRLRSHAHEEEEGVPCELGQLYRILALVLESAIRFARETCATHGTVTEEENLEVIRVVGEIRLCVAAFFLSPSPFVCLFISLFLSNSLSLSNLVARDLSIVELDDDVMDARPLIRHTERLSRHCARAVDDGDLN